jgi:hypothetical protein
MKRSTLILAGLVLMLGGVGQARVDYIATVTVDTSKLTSNPGQGPFAVDFFLLDQSGDPSSNNNNTAKISNFDLHGGSLTSGTISTGGSPSGDLGSTLTLQDSPEDSFLQQFTPGSSTPSSLSFTLDLTTNVTGSETFSPDFFLFRVLSNGETRNASNLDIDITGPNPRVDPSGFSLGNGVLVPAPVVTPLVSSAPEPSTLTLFGLGSLGLLGYGRRRRKA